MLSTQRSTLQHYQIYWYQQLYLLVTRKNKLTTKNILKNNRKKIIGSASMRIKTNGSQTATNSGKPPCVNTGDYTCLLPHGGCAAGRWWK